MTFSLINGGRTARKVGDTFLRRSVPPISAPRMHLHLEECSEYLHVKRYSMKQKKIKESNYYPPSMGDELGRTKSIPPQ